MRVLWTLPYLPWPITSGGKARQYHLLRRMAARGHAITLLVQSKTPADEAVQQALKPLLERLIVVPRRSLRSPRTLWHAATSSAPLLASVNGFAPALSQQFDALLNEHWDVIQIEHSYGFQPFADSLARRGRPFILTEHNVESELGAATYGKWPALLRPLARYDQWRARRWEQCVMSRAAAIVAVTESDATTLGAISGRPAHVVSNGVDTRGFAQVQPDPLAMAILFVGNYEYAPNVDAVEWAAGEIMPLVWQQPCSTAGASASLTPASSGAAMSTTCPPCSRNRPCSSRPCALAAAPNSRCSKPWRRACPLSARKKACRAWARKTACMPGSPTPQRTWLRLWSM
jgi:hypothetical protein